MKLSRFLIATALVLAPWGCAGQSQSAFDIKAPATLEQQIQAIKDNKTLSNAAKAGQIRALKAKSAS